jgi:hypothetical protein
MVDYSIAYLYDRIVWVVPLAKLQPLWMNLGNAFGYVDQKIMFFKI